MPLPEPGAGSTALVTGASSGIGLEIARGLARRGHGVTLVARRRDRLEELAKELAADHGVRAEVITADLADPSDRDSLAEQVAANGLDVEILVNNAGFGIYEPFTVSDRAQEMQQLHILVEAVVDLNARFLPPMLERDRGAILNVSSSSAFQVLPGNGTYAAAKAYVLFHSEALSVETRKTGVTVTASCPGPVHSEFQETSEPLFADSMPGFLWIDAKRCAEDSLKALEKGKRMVVPGPARVAAFFGPNRVAPPSLKLAIARRAFKGELERGAGRGAS
jgi:hypothetical protein